MFVTINILVEKYLTIYVEILIYSFKGLWSKKYNSQSVVGTDPNMAAY